MDSESTCLSEVSEDGECEVYDVEMAVTPENKIITQIYNEALGTAAHVEAKDKTYLYLKPTEVAAILRSRMIPQEEWAEILSLLFMLQEWGNHYRLKRPKPKTK